jgi:hypothetical protein
VWRLSPNQNARSNAFSINLSRTCQEMQTTSREVQLFKPDIFKDGEHGTINAVCTYPVNAEAEPTMLVDPQEQSLQDLWRQPEKNDRQMTARGGGTRECIPFSLA